MKSSINVAVIGAGIVGASIGFYLSRMGAGVTIFEKNEPASGASGHSFAWINSFNKTPRSYHEFNHNSMERWARFERLLNHDIGLKWGGNACFTTSDSDGHRLKQNIERLQSWGYPARLIEKSELADLEPGLKIPSISAAGYTWADGHVMPERVVKACINRIIETGGRIFDDTYVDSIQQNSSSVYVITDKEKHEFDVVVIAAGVNSTELGGSLNLKLPQRVSPGVVIKTDPMSNLLKSLSVLQIISGEGEEHQIHIRQDKDGVVMIGTGSQEHELTDDSQSHAENLLLSASRYIPELKNTKAIPIPVGYRPMPVDDHPIIGFSQKAPNVYVALMHSGVTLAPIVGELASIEITGSGIVETLSPYRPSRFSHI